MLIITATGRFPTDAICCSATITIELCVSATMVSIHNERSDTIRYLIPVCRRIKPATVFNRNQLGSHDRNPIHNFQSVGLSLHMHTFGAPLYTRVFMVQTVHNIHTSTTSRQCNYRHGKVYVSPHKFNKKTCTNKCPHLFIETGVINSSSYKNTKHH